MSKECQNRDNQKQCHLPRVKTKTMSSSHGGDGKQDIYRPEKKSLGDKTVEEELIVRKCQRRNK